MAHLDLFLQRGPQNGDVEASLEELRRIVLTDGHTGTPELAEELRDWVRTRFAPHAAPHTVDFIDELPRSASGKMRRARLR